MRTGDVTGVSVQWGSVMKRWLGVRTIVAAVALFAAVLGILAMVPDTEAALGLCTYFSAPNKRTVVGQRGTDCCGVPVSWGIVTPYRTCEQIYCLDIWCPPPIE